MDINEVIKRLNYIKNLYELTIIPMLNDKRDIPDAKKDIKALEIVIELLERRVI